MSKRFFTFETIGVGSPYMTRLLIGPLRLHIFHRPDGDPDCHDHPWAFVTFPLTSYVEEVTEVERFSCWSSVDNQITQGERVQSYPRVVRAFRFHYRSAEYCHRILGRWNGKRRIHPQQRAEDCMIRPGPIVSLVWRGPGERRWGFLTRRDGKTCWLPWRDYVFGDRTAPCQPST